MTAVKGHVAVRLECRPAFNYARDAHVPELTPGGAVFRSPSLSLGLATGLPLKVDGTGVTGDFTLDETESMTFVLQQVPDGAGAGFSLSGPSRIRSSRRPSSTDGAGWPSAPTPSGGAR